MPLSQPRLPARLSLPALYRRPLPPRTLFVFVSYSLCPSVHTYHCPRLCHVVISWATMSSGRLPFDRRRAVIGKRFHCAMACEAEVSTTLAMTRTSTRFAHCMTLVVRFLHSSTSLSARTTCYKHTFATTMMRKQGQASGILRITNTILNPVASLPERCKIEGLVYSYVLIASASTSHRCQPWSEA
jgi:transcription elongation factor Elf1